MVEGIKKLPKSREAREKTKQENYEKRDWCSSHEAARILRVASATVVEWTEAGYLYCVRTLGGALRKQGHRRYQKKHIEEFNAKLERGGEIAPLWWKNEKSN